MADPGVPRVLDLTAVSHFVMEQDGVYINIPPLSRRLVPPVYGLRLSPGASKPATYGHFKTSQDSWGVSDTLFDSNRLDLLFKVSGVGRLLFPPGMSSIGPAVRPFSRHPVLARTGSNGLLRGALGAGGRFGWF